MTATSRRVEAITRLVDICGASWDPLLIAKRRQSAQVLARKALRAAGDDEALLDEVRDLWPIATGETEPLIDAALTGLPERPAPVVPVSVDELEAALADWR